ncbi:MAG: TrmH family RNA methyltransferase, partial [Bacteroidales bacterium]|nr:TrmH family RNA methyltransferase [Bacteroidales bacterium]
AIITLRGKGYFIVAIEQTVGSIQLDSFKLPETPGIGIVFGNEVSGVDQQIIELVDACVDIPQFGTKHSLNVAVSAGIVIWEIFNKLSDIYPERLQKEPPKN